MKKLFLLMGALLLMLSNFKAQERTIDTSKISITVDRSLGTLTYEYKKFLDPFGANLISGGDEQYQVIHGESISIKLESEANSAYLTIANGSVVPNFRPQGGSTFHQLTITPTSGLTITNLHPEAWKTPLATNLHTTQTNQFAKLQFNNLPAKYFNANVVIKLNARNCHYQRKADRTGHYAFNGGSCNTGSSDYVKTYAIPSIGEAQNVQSTTNQNCAGTPLSWTAGANMSSLSSARYKVKRKVANTGDPYTVISTTAATNYLDTSASAGTEYEYKIQSGLEFGGGRSIYAAETPVSVRGSKLGLVTAPKGLFIDQANCNGHLDITWNYAGTSNPPLFEIKKATNAAFTANVTTEEVSGSDRTWRDVNATSGTTYFYAVQGKAGCPNAPGTSTYSALSNTESEIGNGTPGAPVVSGVSTNATNKSVTLNWQDNTSLEHSYKVIRISGNGSTEFQVGKNTTSYTDNSAQACENYTYQVKAINDQCAVSGVLSTNDTTAYIPANISSTFNTTHKLEASDGDFGDRIELRWTAANRQNENWYIKRKNLSNNSTIQVASVSGGSRFYADNSADANTLYEYTIFGDLDCAGNVLTSDSTEDVGFRLAFGTINGQITYSGGTAVKGVKVTAEPASGASGQSGEFNGTSTYAAIANKAQLNTNEVTATAFIRPHSNSGRRTIIDKTNGSNGYLLTLEGNQLKGKVGTQELAANIPNFSVNNWISVGLTIDNDTLKLFANGTAIGTWKHNQQGKVSLNDGIQIGRDGTNAYFDGEIDEVRIYNRALSNLEIARSFDVYINPSANGLVGYWRFDEGFGNTAFDYSKTVQNNNKNHASLHQITWSNQKPSTSQLTAGAYTNELGSYFIPFIPYLGSGDNYTITPTFGTHSFTPATTTLLVGSGSSNYTGQDFTDNSSFDVSGSVKYKNTNCFVKEARLLIDGEVVIRNGEVAQTDANGSFQIQVPIGPHVVTVEKNSHDFSAGRFPSAGAYDFQQNVTGIQFIDSTLVKVVGRAAGGSIQKALPPGLGRGKNNIGLAKIPFKAQQGNGCLVDTAISNSSTGEYSIQLPPLRYEVPNFSIPSQQSIEFRDNSLLDLSTVPPVQVSKDSVFNLVNNRKVLDRVDSIEYQTQRDFMYFTGPSIDVLGSEIPTQYGADTVNYNNNGINVDIPTSALNLTYPVFLENKKYAWKISAFEIYENKDNLNSSIRDSVPMLEGNIEVFNNLANKPDTTFEYKITDTVPFSGIQEYRFIAGQARTSIDAIDPAKSFTKTAEITARPDNGNAVSWKPNSSDPTNQDFRGIVFGGRALGNSFATQGPQAVTMILRDPPGTGSSASWTEETSVTNFISFGVEAGLAANLTKEISLGTEFDVGLGYSTPTSIKSSVGNKLSTELSVGAEGELIETTSRSSSIFTGEGDEFVGGDADLFFGRSINMDFGLSQILSLVDTANCNGNCSGPPMNFNGVTYRIGTTISMFAIPKGYETEFVFSQAGIENSVIPKLESLRNQLLTSDPMYNSLLPASDARYGLSNDDPVFGNGSTPDEFNNTMDDSLGLSYHFTGYSRLDTSVQRLSDGVSQPVTIYEGIDSVWWYNRQIALWVNTLAENERAKVKAKSGNADRNISYQGGNVIKETTSTTRSESVAAVLNFSLSKEMTLAVGVEIGGAGGGIEQSTSLSMNTNSTIGTSQESTSTFEYTISDPDADDEFTVDVFKPTDGYGPIFITRGGQTSCPYQGETKTKYYQPGTVLDKATIQLEQPRISASPSSLFNIPANGQGNIALSLINDGLEDAIYSFKVLENTNPNGAILKIDGINPNRDFAVPAQTAITKTLVVEKGPNHIAYDSIGLVFHSTCQYAFGTAGYEDIADTVYISVNFLSSCTELNIQAPQNQFIANNSFNNSLPVRISGYDINYGGLEKIELQYKPSNQASWVTLGTEWFKDTVDINTRYPNHIDPQQIPRSQSYITYQLEMEQLIDQDYDLRAISTCKIPFNPDFSQESAVISGVFDRVNPHPFGSPSPADGVLDPNDDISIRFNEQIEAGSLTLNNFQITGVLNGQELRHNKSIAFNGTTQYLEIANGFDFASGDFTVEFWMNRKGLGTKQTILSQGQNAGNNFSIGWNTNNKLFVTIGQATYESNFVIIDDSLWHHYAITYDKDNTTLEISDRQSAGSQISTNNNFFASFQSGGKTFIGKNAENNGDYLNGSMHELRIWNRPLNASVVASRINQNLTGREAGLIGYWPMDKGRGVLAEDVARMRNADMKAEWEINPKSTSVGLNGVDQYVSVDTAGAIAMTQEMDLSIEFWFKTAGGKLQTMLSNGSGMFSAGDANRNGWNIEMNAQNEIWVKNDSFAFKAVENNFADDEWHHFALVVNRLANATAYIDGQQQKSTTATNFWGFSGSKLLIGARFGLSGVIESVDQYFDGELDEVRIWSTALLKENIELNRYNRLQGNEFGLQAYYPFESYRLDGGVPILDASNNNASTVLRQPERTVARQAGGNLFSTTSPAVALQRPVEKIKYSWSVNNDEIVITPNEDAANIENVTLNVSVQNIRDLRGNVMQSPKTWIAFVNKNQVLWQDAEKNLSKEFNDTMSFTSRVINSGGDAKNFTINNIPAWLTVSPSSGSVAPLSSTTINFTVNPAINIGDYTEDLLLSTDFGFNEKLLVNLKVRKTPPAFNFDRNLYSKSMNVIGQIAINGSISTNDGDILVAYMNNEVRGKANLQYMPTLDRYMAFLDVYSNSADSITFKVWNSAEGELHEDVTPNLYFVENSLVGSVLNPQIFDAVYNLAKPIVLNAGWNWVSFPLSDHKMSSITSFFQGTNFSSGDVVKTIGNNAFAQYGGPSFGWSGGLTRDGLNNHQSYLIHIAAKDTLMYSGLTIDPDTMPINVVSGWNRIGFVSSKNMAIGTALANFNATDGDLIKSQQAFAVYVTNLGWVGSLTTLEPTEGYLLKSAGSANFVYPRRGLLRIKEEPVQQKLEDVIPALYDLNPNAFEASTNAIIKINTCEEILANENWSLAAFKNKELRGFTEKTQFVNEDLGHQYFITVYGQGNETYTFKMINQESGEQMEVLAKLDFEKNKLQGEVANPLQFNLFNEVDCDQFKVIEPIVDEVEQLSYPNPFSKFVTIVVPNSITETGQVQIIDKNGRVVFNRDVEDARKFHLNGAELYFLTNGVYTLKFTDGKTVVTEKLVRIK